MEGILEHQKKTSMSMKLDNCCSWVWETSTQIHPYTYIHTVDRRIVHRLISSLSHYLQGLCIPGGAGYLQSTEIISDVIKKLGRDLFVGSQKRLKKMTVKHYPKDPIVELLRMDIWDLYK